MKCLVPDCGLEIIDNKKGWKKYCCINHRRVPPLLWNCTIEGCINKIYSENMRKRYCKDHIKQHNRDKGKEYYHRVRKYQKLERKKKLGLKCVMCSNPLLIERHSRKFCSVKCMWTWHRRKNNIEKMLNKKKTYKECMLCKKLFLVKSIIHKFCSGECTVKAYRMTHRKEVLLC